MEHSRYGIFCTGHVRDARKILYLSRVEERDTVQLRVASHARNVPGDSIRLKDGALPNSTAAIKQGGNDEHQLAG